MSKMDNLRAMREAKFDKNAARTGTDGAAPRRYARPPVAPPVDGPAAATAAPAAATPSAAPEGAAGTEELCGHKNMGGRSCTREKGHAAKSHRYS
ncbi:hypothetical protein SAMN04488570_1555 [Nocardioides scoriae]|uniref:Uncharacterized protein n=1 Tax=Nocardioides scoriae TaxID=642780 RepID=A0A1H1R0B3_9ACTN|nr:hypothetical protein [Nocardioides scoriae]SDS29224.1 hypothetical protein SAMN04488570_1555 [Nocardioides scoriae]